MDSQPVRAQVLFRSLRRTSSQSLTLFCTCMELSSNKEAGSNIMFASPWCQPIRSCVGTVIILPPCLIGQHHRGAKVALEPASLLELSSVQALNKVGCYLKTPKLPIWLVCSESHFSVLFCLSKDLLGDWKAERRFDLLYYDGLANQQEEIRLTIDTSQPYDEDKEDGLIPPLEHCIRTKWKGAVVSWNGTEPIL